MQRFSASSDRVAIELDRFAFSLKWLESQDDNIRRSHSNAGVPSWMVNDADINRDSKFQQALATVTMHPMIAPLNMMVKVVIKEENSADGASGALGVSAEE
jgi:hypothetical protein